jgi:hypothetical protein
MKWIFETVLQTLVVLWVMLAEFPASILRSILVWAGWLRLNDCLLDEWCIVRVYEAKGWLARRFPARLVGVSLPATIVLAPSVFPPAPPSTRAKLVAHELEHCHQWCRWSILFPLAYCVAGLIALPWPYRNNRFEMAARAAADKVTKS